jgi:hypothetical protein
MAQPTNGMQPSVARDERMPNSRDAESEWVLECNTRRPGELTESGRYESLYLEKDEECAVLRQRLRQLATGNQLGDSCLPIGGMLIGLTASVFDRGHSMLGLVMLLTGIALIGGRLRLKYNQKAD